MHDNGAIFHTCFSQQSLLILDSVSAPADWPKHVAPALPGLPLDREYLLNPPPPYRPRLCASSQSTMCSVSRGHPLPASTGHSLHAAAAPVAQHRCGTWGPPLTVHSSAAPPAGQPPAWVEVVSGPAGAARSHAVAPGVGVSVGLRQPLKRANSPTLPAADGNAAPKDPPVKLTCAQAGGERRAQAARASRAPQHTQGERGHCAAAAPSRRHRRGSAGR